MVTERPQYFLESQHYSLSHHIGAVSHHDARFAPEQSLSEDEMRTSLRGLLGSYLAAMDQNHEHPGHTS